MVTLIELLKLCAQMYFSIASQIGLDEAAQLKMLSEERAKFEENKKKPLPDV